MLENTRVEEVIGGPGLRMRSFLLLAPSHLTWTQKKRREEIIMKIAILDVD
jgi:hypothetical protein